jgi:hypothetical protein
VTIVKELVPMSNCLGIVIRINPALGYVVLVTPCPQKKFKKMEEQYGIFTLSEGKTDCKLMELEK